MVANPPVQIIPEHLQVLYEDNHLIVVHKPAGMLVQGDQTGDVSLLDVVKQYIKNRYRKPGQVFVGLVHRLDRPVSGVVLFARTSKAASRLSAQWRTRSVEKTYWALVHGGLEPEQGTLSSYLRKGRHKVRLRTEDGQKTQHAILSYRTIERKKGFSLLEIFLQTGRKHQIRVQLSASGCPIVGDVKYGGVALGKREIRLTAHALSFVHPTKGEKITVESPPPEWAREFLDRVPTTPHPGGFPAPPVPGSSDPPPSNGKSRSKPQDRSDA